MSQAKVEEKAHTEFSFAYNRGTVVGFEDKFFNSSVTDGQTPPLHPRCRCVIVYREITVREKKSVQVVLRKLMSEICAGNLMTIHYTNDKIGLEFVNSIIPLKELLKELKKCYGTEVTKRRD